MDSILSYQKLPGDDYYYILGCDELSSVEQIHAEYKVRALACHPDKHQGNTEAAEKFARLQKAKETLCDPECREEYDKWRRSGMCMSYPEWCSRKNAMHTSMHWASVAKKEYMLEEGKKTSQSRPKLQQQASVSSLDEDAASPQNAGFSDAMLSRLGWQREDSEILRKFRNYEI